MFVGTLVWLKSLARLNPKPELGFRVPKMLPKANNEEHARWQTLENASSRIRNVVIWCKIWEAQNYVGSLGQKTLPQQGQS